MSTLTQWGYHLNSLQRHFRVVSLAEISIPRPSDPERISSLYQNSVTGTEIAVEPAHSLEVTLDITDVIRLGRFGDETLYKVGNGRHRLNVAKMLGVTHILALVDELKT